MFKASNFITFAWRIRIGIWISLICWSDTNPTSFFVKVPEKNHSNQGIFRHKAAMGCFVTSSWMLLKGDSRTSLKKIITISFDDQFLLFRPQIWLLHTLPVIYFGPHEYPLPHDTFLLQLVSIQQLRVNDRV